MVISKIALSNKQKFKIKYSSFNLMAYIIAIIKTNLGKLKTRQAKNLCDSFKIF